MHRILRSPLSEGSAGYSVAENKVIESNNKTLRIDDITNSQARRPDGRYATAGHPCGADVSPQFSTMSDIKPTHGNSGSTPKQPGTGYHRAD